MTAPDKIHITQIEVGERARTEYKGLEDLAQTIEDNGLIQPIVLVLIPSYDEVDGSEYNEYPGLEKYGLDAGGRRYFAHKLLLDEGKWDGYFHHANTSVKGAPGYVLKGPDESTPLKRLLTELAENHDRQDLDWKDDVKLLVRAYKLAVNEGWQNNKPVLMRQFGAIVGCGYADLQAAVAVHDDLIANPDRYKETTGVRGAYALMLKVQAAEVAKLHATRSLSAPVIPSLVVTQPVVQAQPQPAPGEIPVTEIALTKAFFNCDSLKFMADLPEGTFDHIFTDPDYAVSVERLEANMENAGAGVVQKSVDESLETLRQFLFEAARIIKPGGFCVFWYDSDHHEKLQQIAIANGFRTQRWLLVWHKTDYRSNAAPSHNFCKNYETAMVCRKPNAVLARAQMSSIFSCPTGDVTRKFNHPFAKPLDVWKWLFAAVTIKGQTIYDPFLGSGTSVAAAAQWGLRPVGSEINPEHYNNMLMNMREVYKKLVTGEVKFT